MRTTKAGKRIFSWKSSSMNMCAEGEEKAEGSVVGEDLVCLIFKALDFILWAVESMEGL